MSLRCGSMISPVQVSLVSFVAHGTTLLFLCPPRRCVAQISVHIHLRRCKSTFKDMFVPVVSGRSLLPKRKNARHTCLPRHTAVSGYTHPVPCSRPLRYCSAVVGTKNSGFDRFGRNRGVQKKQLITIHVEYRIPFDSFQCSLRSGGLRNVPNMQHASFLFVYVQ